MKCGDSELECLLGPSDNTKNMKTRTNKPSDSAGRRLLFSSFVQPEAVRRAPGVRRHGSSSTSTPRPRPSPPPPTGASVTPVALWRVCVCEGGGAAEVFSAAFLGAIKETAEHELCSRCLWGRGGVLGGPSFTRFRCPEGVRFPFMQWVEFSRHPGGGFTAFFCICRICHCTVKVTTARGD